MGCIVTALQKRLIRSTLPAPRMMNFSLVRIFTDANCSDASAAAPTRWLCSVATLVRLIGLVVGLTVSLSGTAALWSQTSAQTSAPIAPQLNSRSDAEPGARAQPATATRQTASWRDALRLLDSASPADIVAAESILRQAIAAGGAPAEAVCTLALVRLRQTEPTDALALVDGLATTYDPAELQSTRAVALRIRLCAALMIDDASQVDSAFKDLVRWIVAGAGDPTDLRFSAITIGVVEAMLEIDLAQSPITGRNLRIGRGCMLDSRVPGVASSYSAAYAQASERAGELARQFAMIADKGIEAVAAENAERLQSLDKSLGVLVQQKELTSEIFRNAREQTQQNTRDRRKLDSQIAMKMRQPTPGHPGPQRPAPPPPPPRSTIGVEEFELRTDYDTIIRNGETIQIPVTRQVRRSQYDIGREREQKYQHVLRDYQQIRADYDRYAQNHQNALKSWTEADRLRRQNLAQQRGEFEAKRAELLAASERIKDEQRDTAKEFSAQRNEKEQEAFELELQSIALAAAAEQNIAGAFRPRNFPVVSWSQEKALLQRNTFTGAP